MAIPLQEKETGRPVNLETDDYDENGFPIAPFVYSYDEEGYLCSDGQPMAEYDINREQMTNSIKSLKAWYGDRAVYVSGNNFLHYRREDYLPKEKRTKRVSPDCYVVFGVTNELRDNYKTWENDNRTPAIVFEFTSKKTKTEDEDDKFALYENVLKVPEYIMFDPNGDYLTPPFQGWRLNAEGVYQPIPVENGRMFSESLDMFMEIREGDIRFTDAVTGEYLRTPYEAEHERRQEKARADNETQRADRETQARQALEAQMAAMQAELEALRQKDRNTE